MIKETSPAKGIAIGVSMICEILLCLTVFGIPFAVALYFLRHIATDN